MSDLERRKIMKKFNKITVGFVIQHFEKNVDDKFICTNQKFIAGDQVDYENEQGDLIEPPEYSYQKFNMKL